VGDALEDWFAHGVDELSERTVTLYRGTIVKALNEELGTVRVQPLGYVARVLDGTQAPFSLQPGKEGGTFRPLERDQPGDGRSVLGDFDRLTPAHASDHLTGVVAQLSQPH
jgi:hypothetical protein